jgi:hypothetical protein
VVRCDPSVALQFSYETEAGGRERLNTYFGYSAVGAVRIVQQPGRLRGESPCPAATAEAELPAELESLAGGRSKARYEIVAHNEAATVLGRIIINDSRSIVKAARVSPTTRGAVWSRERSAWLQRRRRYRRQANQGHAQSTLGLARRR